MKKYLLSFLVAYAVFSFSDKYLFNEDKLYNTYVEDHCWFLKTPDGDLPIRNNQVGDIYHRMKGLMDEEPDSLKKSLEKIRQDLVDY